VILWPSLGGGEGKRGRRLDVVTNRVSSPA
jgi:hypothetical protein